MQRSLIIALVLAVGMILTAQAEGTPLCILKEFAGEVRVRTASGDLRVAEIGALYDGETLVLGQSGEVTLIAGKESVDLSGPLELPITAQVLKGSGGKDKSSLVERLASLLPSLRGNADYEGGSVKNLDGSALALIGPRGKMLSGQWLFVPCGGADHFTLELIGLDSSSAAGCRVESQGTITVGGIPGKRFEYVYYDGGAENADWSLTVQFERVDPATAREVQSRMERECQTTLDRVLWLADQGYFYDAWTAARQAAKHPGASGEQALLASLANRLAATLYAGIL